MLRRNDTNRHINISMKIFLTVCVVLTSLAAINLYRIGHMLSLFGAPSGIAQSINMGKQSYRVPLTITEISHQQPLDCIGGCDETIDQTISRIKKDVVVTGTLTGITGKESAIFSIEGMPGKVFFTNTQLMDGFIIKEITSTQVVLKNQLGDETISLKVENRVQAR